MIEKNFFLFWKMHAYLVAALQVCPKAEWEVTLSQEEQTETLSFEVWKKLYDSLRTESEFNGMTHESMRLSIDFYFGNNIYVQAGRSQNPVCTTTENIRRLDGKYPHRTSLCFHFALKQEEPTIMPLDAPLGVRLQHVWTFRNSTCEFLFTKFTYGPTRALAIKEIPSFELKVKLLRPNDNTSLEDVAHYFLTDVLDLASQIQE